jgi:hypothetical protein
MVHCEFASTHIFDPPWPVKQPQISEEAAPCAGSLIDTAPRVVARDGLPVRRPALQERGTSGEDEFGMDG